MIPLDRALDRLLHSRSYRQALLDGRYHELELAPDDLAAVASIDRDQLVAAAERVARDLLSRRHRGSGGLLELYPRTLAAWSRLHPEDESFTELLLSFSESPAFDGYRQVPFAGAGWSLEEAFFRFCEAEDIGDAVTRERELLGSLLRALAVCPTADFTLPDRVLRVEGGFVAVTTRGAPLLYAAVRGRFLTGSVTPFLAELLTCPEPPEHVATRHAVSQPVLAASLAQLAALGLRPSVAVGQ